MAPPPTVERSFEPEFDLFTITCHKCLSTNVSLLVESFISYDKVKAKCINCEATDETKSK